MTISKASVKNQIPVWMSPKLREMSLSPADHNFKNFERFKSTTNVSTLKKLEPVKDFSEDKKFFTSPESWPQISF